MIYIWYGLLLNPCFLIRRHTYYNTCRHQYWSIFVINLSVALSQVIFNLIMNAKHWWIRIHRSHHHEYWALQNHPIWTTSKSWWTMAYRSHHHGINKHGSLHRQYSLIMRHIINVRIALSWVIFYLIMNAKHWWVRIRKSHHHEYWALQNHPIWITSKSTLFNDET